MAMALAYRSRHRCWPGVRARSRRRWPGARGTSERSRPRCVAGAMGPAPALRPGAADYELQIRSPPEVQDCLAHPIEHGRERIGGVVQLGVPYHAGQERQVRPVRGARISLRHTPCILARLIVEPDPVVRPRAATVQVTQGVLPNVVDQAGPPRPGSAPTPSCDGRCRRG